MKILSLRTGIMLGMAVILLVACILGCTGSSVIWDHQQVLAVEITSPVFQTREGFSMLVFYWYDTDYYQSVIKGTHNFVHDDISHKLYLDDNPEPIINDTTQIGWELYPEQYFEVPTVWDEQLGSIPVDITLEDLGLRDFVAGDLPQSGHYVRLDAVYPSATLKAEVSRYYYGAWYGGIRCLVTLSVYQSYGTDIQIGDYLWAYYTNDPREGHENEEIPIVVDKVIVD